MTLDISSGLINGISWTTVVISIGGSLLVSISSEWVQFVLRRRERRKQNLENWYHETVSIAQKLRNRSFKIPYGENINKDIFRSEDNDVNEKIIVIENIVSDLVNLHAEAPPEADEEVLNNIQELDFWFNHPEEVNDIDTTDLRDKCKDSSESIIDEAVKESDRYDEAPY